MSTAPPPEVRPPVDLLGLTAALVDMASVSRAEGPLVTWLSERLAACKHLRVERVGDNLVARTELGRPTRIVLAGHTDTVPPQQDNARASVVEDRLYGVGSADMKGGLACMIALAESAEAPTSDVSYVFYAREEVAAAESGLGELFDRRPELVAGDVAILGEPTGGVIEAGCQGTLRVRVELRGERAHTARPWMGRNAIHRLGPLLNAVERMPLRQPSIDGCQYREALQVVAVEGGIAGNVVPDVASMTINHRFAPDRSGAQALEQLQAVISEVLEDDDLVELTDLAESAAPGLDHPILASLVAQGLAVRAKLGWTDVARFAAAGIPAVNLGPGDPELAHTAEEHLDRGPLEAVYRALHRLLHQS